MFFKKKKSPLSEVDVNKVRRRVHGIREAEERMGSLQLFAKLGEELKTSSANPRVIDSGKGQTYTFGAAPAESDRPRVLPGQIPSSGER